MSKESQSNADGSDWIEPLDENEVEPPEAHTRLVPTNSKSDESIFESETMIRSAEPQKSEVTKYFEELKSAQTLPDQVIVLETPSPQLKPPAQKIERPRTQRKIKEKSRTDNWFFKLGNQMTRLDHWIVGAGLVLVLFILVIGSFTAKVTKQAEKPLETSLSAEEEIEATTPEMPETPRAPTAYDVHSVVTSEFFMELQRNFERSKANSQGR